MSEKRLFERAEFDGEVTVTPVGAGGDGEAFHARVRDLSVGGVYILSETKPPFGTEVKLLVRLPALTERGKGPVILAGVVRWAREDGFGVQFGPTGALETWALADYVARKNHGI